MRIDAVAEDLGREAVRAAIVRDRLGLQDALEAIAEADPVLRERVLPIYCAIGRQALSSIYGGARASQEQNLEMARQIRRKESSWAVVEVRELWEMLESLSLDEHVPQMAAERLPITLFVVVRNLLACCTETSGFATSFDCLDAIVSDLDGQLSSWPGTISKAEP
jgi:hypothetical protein